MESFGIRFRSDRLDLYPPLVAMFEAFKQAQIHEEFGEVDESEARLAAPARTFFHWPTKLEQEEWSAVRASHPTIVTRPENAWGQ
ncbi:hypothetical protein [Rhizobacter sp. LjRoot28]|uniref:hypothetical protein n=1 Tax=Rhizobacter sp. LjRoot28 TaxID=3342309 RepID=UPI003ECDB5C0